MCVQKVTYIVIFPYREELNPSFTIMGKDKPKLFSQPARSNPSNRYARHVGTTSKTNKTKR